MSGKPFSTTKRILAALFLTGASLALAGGGYLYWKMHDNLPLVDGTARVSGLQGEVVIERDSYGVPSIRATSEEDAYRALGYVHAQDRFFQMDMLRRRAAGELSAVVGKATLELDSEVVGYEFRRLARENFARMPEAQQRLARAYTEGVNTLLNTQASPPWEYALLRTTPKAWLPEDCLLPGFTMTLELQDAGYYEKCVTVLRDTLGEQALQFFAPEQAPGDAAMDGSTAPLPHIPGPRQINLRPAPETPNEDLQLMGSIPNSWGGSWVMDTGSNAFAIAGAHTQTGVGMVASDMHLGLSVPNTFYKTKLSWRTAQGAEIHFTGLTMPGGPVPVAGSNGQIAWAFTAGYADTCDLVPIEHDPLARQYYATPSGDAKLEEHEYTLEVRGGAPKTLTRTWTLWGPVVGTDDKQRGLALKWVALQPGAIDLGFGAILKASTVEEALIIGQNAGLPALNMLVADRKGAIGWTLAGALPKRLKYSGRYPVVHSFGDRSWQGLLPAEEHPSIVYPKSGYLSSANERLFGGAKLELLGDGGYCNPHRARQLRKDTQEAAERGGVQEKDLLAIQLDNRALALAPWTALLKKTLAMPDAQKTSGLRKLLAVLEHWDGTASAQAEGYLLVRNFKTAVMRLTLDPLMAPCRERMPDFRWTRFNSEPAVWALLDEKPLHLLDPSLESWEALLLKAAETAQSQAGGKTWGETNIAAIRHPLLRVLPRFLSAWADMPADPLPGDSDMPRVLKPSFGASERFGVSPGNEDSAYMHLPGGQSANPLSPWFRRGHEAWVRGEPIPFEPGPPEHTLVLKP